MPRIMRRFTCSNLIKVIIWPVLVLYVILYAVKDNQVGDFEYHSEYCNCSKKIKRQVAHDSVHFCSEISSARGSHQDVVSYSLYGVAFSNKNKLTRYFSLLDVLPQQIHSFYPGKT